MNIYVNKKTFFYKLKNSCKKEWSEYTNHKFLSDLVNNKLPYKNFKNYLVQDYVFLQQFLKILALSVYKSNNFDEINRSINFIKGIDHEIKLHISYCKKWKIPLKSLNNIVVEKANSAYTDHVLKVGKNGDNLDIFSCLSVCIIGYGEIGFNLSKIKNWKSYGNFSTQMAGFQLAGPVADVSKILYGGFRKSHQSPNAQYNFPPSLLPQKNKKH